MGRVEKGVKCVVPGCDNLALRSIAGVKAAAAGLNVSSDKRAYLCKEHYKRYKKGMKKEKMIEKWRHKI